METRQLNEQPPGKKGLGGWLILPHIGLYLSIILTLVQLLFIIAPIMFSEYWELLTSPDSDFYHSLWAPILIFEMVFNLLLLGLCIFALVQLYGKKSSFPKLMIMIYSASLFFMFVDYLLALQIPAVSEVEDGTRPSDLLRSVLSTAIWIPYFIRSKRVKNTFVN